MTGRLVIAATLTVLLILAWFAGQSDAVLAVVLLVGGLLAFRWDRVQMRKHRREMLRRERLEPTVGRQR